MFTDRPKFAVQTLHSATRRFTCEAPINTAIFTIHFDTTPIDVARTSFAQKVSAKGSIVNLSGDFQIGYK